MKKMKPKSDRTLPAMPQIIPPGRGDLFARVTSILEQARGNVVRAVNANMVLAYWLIGREIVQELQGGEDRAEYGKQILENLSVRLTNRYGRGYSVANLKNFRQFFLIYPDRLNAIRHPAGSELLTTEKRYPAGSESAGATILPLPGRELPSGFSPLLSWSSNYRNLSIRLS